MFLPSLSQNSMFNSSQFHALERRANYCGSDAVCGFHPSSAASNRSLLSDWNSCMKTHGNIMGSSNRTIHTDGTPLGSMYECAKDCKRQSVALRRYSITHSRHARPQAHSFATKTHASHKCFTMQDISLSESKQAKPIQQKICSASEKLPKSVTPRSNKVKVKINTRTAFACLCSLCRVEMSGIFVDYL